MLEKTLESLLDSKEIKPVNPKGNQPRIFIERTVADAESLVLWPSDAKSQLTEKDPDAGKKRLKAGGEEVTEDEIVRWCRSLYRSLSKLWEIVIVKDREAWCATVHGVTKSWIGLSNRTTTTKFFLIRSLFYHYDMSLVIVKITILLI